MDLRLEVLRPAAVAAQPRPAVAALELRSGGRPLGIGDRLGLRESSGQFGGAQPPIWLIVRGGWRKPGSLTWCLSSLRQTASRMSCSSSSSLGARAQRLAQVGLVQAEQAGAELALGGQPDPVAVARRTAPRRG